MPDKRTTYGYGVVVRHKDLGTGIVQRTTWDQEDGDMALVRFDGGEFRLKASEIAPISLWSFWLWWRSPYDEPRILKYRSGGNPAFLVYCAAMCLSMALAAGVRNFHQGPLWYLLLLGPLVVLIGWTLYTVAHYRLMRSGYGKNLRG